MEDDDNNLKHQLFSNADNSNIWSQATAELPRNKAQMENAKVNDDYYWKDMLVGNNLLPGRESSANLMSVPTHSQSQWEYPPNTVTSSMEHNLDFTPVQEQAAGLDSDNMATLLTNSYNPGLEKILKTETPVSFFDYLGKQNTEDLNLRGEGFCPEEKEINQSQQEFYQEEKICFETDQQSRKVGDGLEDFSKPMQDVGILQQVQTSDKSKIDSKSQITIAGIENPYRCSICGESFNQCGELSRHTRIHMEQKLYICSVCDMDFFLSEDLETHMKTHMGEDPLFKCFTCYGLFPDKPSLLKHVEETHYKEYSASCSKEDLDKIMKMYQFNSEFMSTRKMRFKCTKCDLVFNTRSRLNQHIRKHTGDKPFQCSVCHMVFTVSNNLVTHMRIHTGERPYKCTLCGRGFTKSSDVTRHMKTHTGEKSHLCTVCGKGFTTSYRLSVHMRTHSGVKPYECEVCQKKFCQKSQWKVHMLKMHDKEINVSGSVNNNNNNNNISEEFENRFTDDHARAVAVMLQQEIDNSLSKETEIPNSAGSPVTCNDSTFSDRDAEFLQDTEVHFENDAEKSMETCDQFNNETLSNHKLRRHKCTECDAGFFSPSALNQHVRTHSGERPYKCSVCDMTFSVSANLMTHMRTHTGERPYACSVCGRAFSRSSDVTRHMKSHTGERPYLCTECGKGFSTSFRLSRHMKIHLGVKPYECDQCHKKFYLKDQLRVHMRTHNKTSRGNNKMSVGFKSDGDGVDVEGETLENIESELHSNSPSLSFNEVMEKSDEVAYIFSKGLYECTKCNKKFLVASAVERHARMHGEKPYHCTMCDMSFTAKNNLVTHVRTHTGERPYKCTVCDRGFIKSSDVTRHMKIHTGEKTHLCSVCGKGFTTGCRLTTHMRIHLGLKPYECSICHKRFCQKSQCTVHMKKYHKGNNNHISSGNDEELLVGSENNGVDGQQGDDVMNFNEAEATNSLNQKVEKAKVNPFRCTVCNAEFRTASRLNLHVRSHTGERPYECSLCYAKFSIKSNLSSHMKTHSGERPFRCEVCDKAFTKKSDVKRHMLIHTGERKHVCQTCGKAFSQKCVLTTHMQIHSGDKPFRCDECYRSFRQKAQLTTHMRAYHSGEKSYECNVCGKRFIDGRVFESHVRIHTGEKPFRCSICDKAFRCPSYLKRHMRCHNRKKATS